MSVNEFHQGALDWIKAEHAVYQGPKFDTDEDDNFTKNMPEWWDNRIDMYLKRARELGLDTPRGRQAVAKAAATAVGYLESVLRVYGSVPAPGFTSGEMRGSWEIGTTTN